MSDGFVTVTMNPAAWTVVTEALVAAAENWTPEDDGPTRDAYYAMSDQINHRVRLTEHGRDLRCAAHDGAA
jgi:hypothetical protein